MLLLCKSPVSGSQDYDKNYTMAVKIVYLKQVASTNDYLSGLLSDSQKRESTMVVADYQESGRGQGAHAWHSEYGKNLLASLLLFPAFLSASDQFHLSRIASLALIDTLKFLGVSACIKWPNDILIQKRKVAGILIENGITGKKISHTIIGIGLNLNQDSYPDFPVKATSVALESGFPADRNQVATLLLESLMERYRELERAEFSSLENDYLEHLFMLNEKEGFSFRGKHFTGIIRGISDLGELLVESDGITRNYGFQEIQYLI